MRLEGKTALITGGGTGLGRAIAELFAREGARVGVSGRRREPLDEVAERIGGLSIPADVSQEEEARAMVRQAVETFGHLDILVNNAGVGRYGPFLETDPRGWQEMIETNLMGTVYATHEALQHMVSRRSGQVINIASVAGTHGIPGEALYCASKHGVVGFTEAVAQEMRPHNVRVTALAPGGINTAWWDASTYGGGDRQQTMAPEAVAEVVLLAATLPENTLMKNAVFFPMQEWH